LRLFVNSGLWRRLIGLSLIALLSGQSIAAETTMPQSLEEARLQAKIVTQVRPDRRFVRAAEFIVQKLADSPTSAPIELKLQDGKWLLTISNEQLGTLSPLPKFEEAYTFLEDVARKHIKDRPNHAADRYDSQDLSRQLDLFLIDDILTATRTIDMAWNDRNSSLPLSLARKAALYLHIQTYDLIGFRDELSGRALAFLAAENALTSASLISERALLATLLGYDDEAEIIASDKNDPAALYALEKSSELVELGQKDTATTATWFLAMRSLFNKSQDSGTQLTNLLKKREPDFERHILALGPVLFSTLDWEAKARAALQVATAIAIKASGRDANSKEPIARTEKIVPVFADGVTKLNEASHGPLLDRELIVTLYENAFSNCINATMYYFLYQYGDPNGARAIEEAIGSTDKGMTAEYLEVLHTRLHESGEGKSRNQVLAVLDSLRYINSSISHSIYSKISSNTDTHQGDPVDAGIAQLKRLDGRPSEYVRLQEMFTHDGFRDLAAVSLVYEAKATPPIKENLSHQAHLAWFLGQTDRLLEIYNDPDLDPEIKGKFIITYLADDASLTTAAKEKLIVDLADKYPSNYFVKFYAVRFFVKQKRYDEAIKIAMRYAESKATAQDLSYPHGICAVADLYAEKGDYEKALSLTQTVAESYTANALNSMALYNIALGNYDEGQEWIDKAKERYEGNSGALANEVYSYWLRREYDRAAKAMKDYKSPLTSSILRHDLAKMFLKALGDKPSPERSKAIAAIKDVGLGDKLGDMGFWFRDEGRYDIVFDFCKYIEEEGLLKEFRGPVLAYNGLRLSEGQDAALKWLKGRVKVKDYPRLGGFAFRESEYTILHFLVPYDDETTIGQYNWALRAAAVAANPEADALMGERVREYYSNRKTDDFYNIAGQYLLGLKDKSALLAAAKSPTEIARGACYLGLKARAEGNYREANEWFQAVFRTGLTELNEYSKARIITANWASVGRSLDIMPEIMKTHRFRDLPGM